MPCYVTGMYMYVESFYNSRLPRLRTKLKRYVPESELVFFMPNCAIKKPEANAPGFIRKS